MNSSHLFSLFLVSSSIRLRLEYGHSVSQLPLQIYSIHYCAVWYDQDKHTFRELSALLTASSTQFGAAYTYNIYDHELQLIVRVAIVLLLSSPLCETSKFSVLAEP